jgi:hypothetical protein
LKAQNVQDAKKSKKGKQQTTQTLKRRLVFLLSSLSVMIIALLFRAGEKL